MYPLHCCLRTTLRCTSTQKTESSSWYAFIAWHLATRKDNFTLPGYGPGAGSCEHGNEASAYIKCGEFVTIWATISFSKNFSSSFSIVTRLRAVLSGFDSWQVWGFLFLPPRPDQLWGALCILFKLYLGLFPGLKRSGLETDSTRPSSTEVKNARSHTSIP